MIFTTLERVIVQRAGAGRCEGETGDTVIGQQSRADGDQLAAVGHVSG